MKKMRIVDMDRFIMFIAIVVMVMAVSTATIYTSSVRAKEPETVVTNEGLQVILESYQLKKVYVRSGDTFWDIQKELTPKEDIGKLMYYASFVNDKHVGELIAGEELFVFEERED